MTVSLFFWLFIFLSLSSNAQKQERFTISHLSGDYYVYTSSQEIDGKPFPANGMFIITKPGIVTLDSPWDTTQANALIDSIERMNKMKVIACIATHFHDDRTGSLDILRRRGIKTYSSYQTYDLCKKRGVPMAEFYFKGDTTFTFGDFKMQTFYPGKGHSPDNIVIWLEEGKVLYGGCFIKSTESETLGNLSDADVPAWLVSIQNVKRSLPKPELVIPGHQGFSGDQCLDHTLQLVKKYLSENK